MEPFASSLTFTLPLHTIVTLGFYAITTVYALFSIIMYYHWDEYSTDAKVTRVTLVLYFASTVPLIIVLGLTTLVIR